MDSPTPPGLEPVLQSFRLALATSPPLRQAVHQLGRWLLELSAPTEHSPPAAAPIAPIPAGLSPTSPVQPSPAPAYQPRPIRGPIEVVIAPEAAAAALQRGLGSGGVSPRHLEPSPYGAFPDAPAPLPIPQIDFKLILQRCKLKVAACDFSRRHDEHHAAGGTMEQLRPDYDALITRGKSLPECFLWMVHKNTVIDDAALLSQVRACYLNLADAAAMMVELGESHGEGHWPDEALWVLAEAQSALYVALARGPWQNPDPDQRAVYGFVRDEARRRQLYMSQYLKEDAPADPDNAPELASLIASHRKEWEADRRTAKARKNAIGRIDYESQQLLKCAPDDRAAHALKIDEGARTYLENSGQLTSAILIDSLRPVREALADLLPPDAAVWRIPAATPAPAAAEDDDEPDERRPGPELLKARALLKGKVVLFIGGEERSQHARKIEDAFELRELRWAAHREHSSLAPLESEIAREDVDLVLLPIRWNGTETGPQIRTWCRTYKKPNLTLKAGYNANQIAHTLLEQVSDRLGGSGP